MRILNKAFYCIAFVLFSIAVPVFAAPTLGEQAIEISKEVRAPDAVNLSLFESNTAEASMIKAKIFELLDQGKNKEQILQYLSERYGKQIRYAPGFDWATALLWIVPGILALFFFAFAIWLFTKARRKTS